MGLKASILLIITFVIAWLWLKRNRKAELEYQKKITAELAEEYKKKRAIELAEQARLDGIKQPYHNSISPLKTECLVELKLKVEFEVTNYGYLTNDCWDEDKTVDADMVQENESSGWEIDKNNENESNKKTILNVEEILTCSMNIEQNFDLQSESDLYFFIENLIDLSEGGEADLLGYDYGKSYDETSLYKGNRGDEISEEWYDLVDKTVWLVTDGDREGEIISDDGQGTFDTVVEGFNIGFEGISRDYDKGELMANLSESIIEISFKNVDSDPPIDLRIKLAEYTKALDFLAEFSKGNH